MDTNFDEHDDIPLIKRSVSHSTRAIHRYKNIHLPMLVAARSKTWVCGCSLAGIAGSNTDGRMDVLSPVSVVCCQVEVTVKGRSLSGAVLLSVTSKPEQSGGLGPLALHSHENK